MIHYNMILTVLNKRFKTLKMGGQLLPSQHEFRHFLIMGLDNTQEFYNVVLNNPRFNKATAKRQILIFAKKFIADLAQWYELTETTPVFTDAVFIKALKDFFRLKHHDEIINPIVDYFKSDFNERKHYFDIKKGVYV